MERPQRGSAPRPTPGWTPPRTNDIDIDEQRKTIRPPRERKPQVPGPLTNTEAPHDPDPPGLIRLRSRVGWHQGAALTGFVRRPGP